MIHTRRFDIRRKNPKTGLVLLKEAPQRGLFYFILRNLNFNYTQTMLHIKTCIPVNYSSINAEIQAWLH